MLADHELDTLAADIKANSLAHPVVIIDGQTCGGTEYTVEVLKRDYLGHIICIETDVRGAEFGETVYVEGIEGDFNSDEDAADHIDEVLDADEDAYYSSRAAMEAEWRAY